MQAVAKSICCVCSRRRQAPCVQCGKADLTNSSASLAKPLSYECLQVDALLVYATALRSHVHSSRLVTRAPFGAAARTHALQRQGTRPFVRRALPVLEACAQSCDRLTVQLADA
jgi:hypothetical protein